MDKNEIQTKLMVIASLDGNTLKGAKSSLKEQGAKKTTLNKAVSDALAQGMIAEIDGKLKLGVKGEIELKKITGASAVESPKEAPKDQEEDVSKKIIKMKGKEKPVEGPEKPKASGTRSSGCLEDFRAVLEKAGEGKTVERATIVERFEKNYGPKGKWTALNYIALAKHGKIAGCHTLKEDDAGNLLVGRATAEHKRGGKKEKTSAK